MGILYLLTNFTTFYMPLLYHQKLVVACIAALSIGLGVGLTRDNDTVDDGRDNTPWEHFRLPDSIIPELYDITLRPDVVQDRLVKNAWKIF